MLHSVAMRSTSIINPPRAYRSHMKGYRLVTIEGIVPRGEIGHAGSSNPEVTCGGGGGGGSVRPHDDPYLMPSDAIPAGDIETGPLVFNRSI